MDCIEAREKIELYIDGMLSEAEKQRLVWHASSCPQCKKALDDAIRLKLALGNLGEIEPPAGLASSAVKKAKKQRIPIYAYATAAAAAVVALAFALSPLFMNNSNLSEAGTEEEIMFSAAEAITEADEGLTMDSAIAEEDAIEAPRMECSLGTGAPLASKETESAALAGNQGLYTFATEAEFAAAIQNGEDIERGITCYYRPEVLPEGTTLQQIEVSAFSVRWVYSFCDGGMLTFEWFRALSSEDLQGWSEQTQLYSDLLAPSFNHSGDLFWSGEAYFNESGQMEATDGTTLNAYWPQDGAAFHMELPASFAEDIMEYSVAEPVPIQ